MRQGLLNDAKLVERVFDHIENGTTDRSEGIWQEPVANYTCTKRFAAEVALLRRSPTPFCPSAALPEIGSFLARPAAGIPLVAVRGEDGVARVFRNGCRHRGAELVAGAGCSRALTCRYHGWTYGTDGQLRSIPHADGFPGLDKRAHGLKPVRTTEQRGMVFVTQEEPELPNEDLRDLPEVLSSYMPLTSTLEHDVAANWKLIAEGLVEGYHSRTTHPETFYSVLYDNINVVETFGMNSRVTFPYRRVERMRSVLPDGRSITGMVSYVYHLFPNVFLATFPTCATMTVLEPMATDRTRQLVYTMSRTSGDADGRAALTKGRDFVKAGAAEDREMSEAAQRGLTSQANDVFTFGLFEGALAHFHRTLTARLEAQRPAESSSQ